MGAGIRNLTSGAASRHGVRIAEVRYYFDADILGLAHVVAALRPDATYPGDPGTVINRRQRPPCPIAAPQTVDSVWIPEVAQRGWLIITRDRHILDHTAEIQAVVDNGAKLVALSGKEAKSTWPQLEVLMTQWRRVEDLVELPGPFVYVATRSGLSKLV